MRRNEMGKIQQRASLHEKAVQAIADGSVAPVSTRIRKAPERRSSRVHRHVVVDRSVMREARQLLSGSYSRIEILDATTVMVR
jgi:hypothetical protein